MDYELLSSEAYGINTVFYLFVWDCEGDIFWVKENYLIFNFDFLLLLNISV